MYDNGEDRCVAGEGPRSIGLGCVNSNFKIVTLYASKYRKFDQICHKTGIMAKNLYFVAKTTNCLRIVSSRCSNYNRENN